MKLHDLKPAEGSRKARKRVGRGIAAGQGKTAGRGTKGQKARAGGSIPPWFEGGQTPLHMRIPKLRGFKNRFRVEYEVVNVGRIGELALLGAFESGELPGGKASAKAAPVTVNQDILRAVGLVRTLSKPLKVLGHGDLETPLFIVADKFSKSAIAKIEAAGGSVQVLEVPTESLSAIGLDHDEAPAAAPKAGPKAAVGSPIEASEVAETADDDDAKPAKAKPSKAKVDPTDAPAKGKADKADKADAKAKVKTPAKGKAEAKAKGKAVAIADATDAPTDPEAAVAAVDDAPTDEDA
jgi:large subunit ribosomal protein L15